MAMHMRKLVIPLLVALVVVAGATWTLRQWQAQLRSGRAQVLGRLLAIEHAPRMLEAPGVEAWLLGVLQDAGARLPAAERGAYEELLHPTWAPQLPASMVAVGELLHRAPPETEVAANSVALREIPAPVVEGAGAGSSLRTVEHWEVDGRTLVLTRRRGLSQSGPPPVALQRAAKHLIEVADGWVDAAVDADGIGPLATPPRVIRFYAVAADGSVLSLPLPRADGGDALEEETIESHRRPRAPSLVSDSMFLELDFGQPLAGQTYYTGLYIDVAGSGLVASVSAPVRYGEDALEVVLAADLSVDIELPRLLEAADPSLRLAVTDPVREVRTPMWQPWSTLGSSLPIDAPEELRREVQAMAIREAREDVWAPQRTSVHHTPDHGRGVLMAVQVSQRRWLVGWLSEAPAGTPWGPMVVVPGLLLGLMLWGARGRRKAVVHALADARQDERNRLAGIVEHGADTLARVLSTRLAAEVQDEGLAFCRWLSEYLLRRLHVSQWVLDRWGGPVCHDVGCILGVATLRGALVQYERIFDVVAGDPGLRAQLHWNNGTLAKAKAEGEAWVKVWIDWPEEWRVTAPTEGLFGYVLGEALVNAVKHGAPGVPVELDVDLDRGRRQLCLRVRNSCATSAEGASPEAKAYGGLAIVTELSRVCGWPLEHHHEDDAFELRWTCPVTQERAGGQVD